MNTSLKKKLIPIAAFVAMANLYSTMARAECCDVPASAAPINEGDKAGGGGEPKEIDVDSIRADLDQWIRAGGARALKLPANLTYAEYEAKMLAVLAPHAVVIGFVDEDDAMNSDLSVRVDGQPKTCRGFIAHRDATAHMLCHRGRYKSASESERYQLIHHEYAGLAGVEKNIGASSDYSISKQISDYLIPITVLRLAVKNVAKPAPIDTSCRVYLPPVRSKTRCVYGTSYLGGDRVRHFAGGDPGEILYSCGSGRKSETATRQVVDLLTRKGYAVVSRKSEAAIRFTAEQRQYQFHGILSYASLSHREVGLTLHFKGRGTEASSDPRRYELREKLQSAKSIAEYQAIQAEMTSAVYRDRPAGDPYGNLKIPTCEEFYGKRSLTLPVNETE